MTPETLARRSLLLVGVPPKAAEDVAEALEGTGIVAERLDDPDEALELAGQLPFDVLIIGVPLGEVHLAYYLSQLRHPRCPSRHAAVLLLVGTGHEPEAAEHVGKGANRMIARSAPSVVLQDAVRALLSVAPRVPLRVALRLDVAIAKGRQKSLCQTENVSATGMLVRTSQALAAGTELRFELTLPRDASPVRGTGKVVRRADELRERVRGVALLIVGFEGKDRDRYNAFLESLTVPPA